jgi:GT2 family glycosyltransferase
VASIEFAVALSLLVLRRGIIDVGRTVVGFGWNGRRRLLYWALEQVAYEGRNSARRYRRWLRTTVASCDPVGSNTLVLVLMTATGDDAAEHDCVESLVRQSHRNWRLVVSPESSVIARRAHLDQRIQTGSLSDQCGHAGPVLLLEARCRLSPSALAELLERLTYADADVVYCDEDVEIDGRPCCAYFKPEFSIDLLRAEDYIGPTILVRRKRLLDRDAFELCLRAYERRLVVVRLARILVHYRAPRRLELTTHQSTQVREHLIRCYGYETAARLRGECSEALSVSLIIPTRDRIDLLEACLDSVHRDASRISLEVIVVNNDSRESRSQRWLASAPGKYPNLRVVDAPYPFNWSKINNEGIAQAHGSVLVFLNNDIEVLEERSLERLATHAIRPDVGTVGALLLYPNGTIQHAGIVLGIFGLADHVYAGCPALAEDRHLFTSPLRSRNVLASTGACLAVSRATLQKIGCFDESLAVCGDVELCVRAYRCGLVNVYEPRARLLHYESETRGRGPLPATEIERLFAACREFIERGDPFYNPGLTRRLRYPDYARVARTRFLQSRSLQ